MLMANYLQTAGDVFALQVQSSITQAHYTRCPVVIRLEFKEHGANDWMVAAECRYNTRLLSALAAETTIDLVSDRYPFHHARRERNGKAIVDRRRAEGNPYREV